MQKLAHKEKKVHIVCATPIWPEIHMNELQFEGLFWVSDS
jgi:hypothetical protein